MALRRDIRAYVETELKDYRDTIKAIEEDRNLIILSSPVHDNNGGKGYDVANPTLHKTIQLMTNKRLRRMEQTVEAIERVLESLPEEKYRLIELKYWTKPQRLTDIGIAMELGCSRRTLYNWIDEIITTIAKEIGLI